ncbi:hypothetical protein A3F07_01365 [candidate division WWE3 bacterium RIFCSPHIGHO2_12_FULL_38_15]|uniref:B3/B4 tRNA-binding domain-containing protein n=1 Tax=candidate division WWE3 bacterium RIFCSPHIGHO2_02_FULL_38_14 TaxID=1802620 RepID=A0A1F4V8Y9_UNCKA|nr:MAG: hypothetical protein A2793_01930 [candidate division WWE3 bacterium RIFCSPHIGHO2_01_FULL_38_45]OGC48356.1 MAG: hypothetical protein A3F07_01365 [candidate division WWE3 bacterium RIFCSPHIGHO2_12_FULL_38_15]OGC53666.1 MAG: hypothetical protein A3D91_04485 [candidate division WWE3 bacterium RIFCSPHIGHO2_02_FULL_38_14]OGC54291.1 MAG: hypothetical protein A3B64_02165 [candidate division WWE3 bacterium RIFCSPLOWO2_01_FULL_37_24]HLB51535.1 phenylalanine--tRNA ligase beta subunit-related prote
MNFTIAETLLIDYPGLFIGVIELTGVNNSGNNAEIEMLLRNIEQEVKEKYTGSNVPEHPHIKPWREAYKKFGSKPNDFRCSSETLLRMVLNGKEIRHISKIVDLYNYISLKYILTLGGEDMDKIKGDLVLTYAKGDENFVPLGSSENDSPQKGEVVYKDDFGVICRRWNWREGDRTKLTEHSKNIVLVAEALPPIENEILKNATKELAELVSKFCGGTIKILFVDSAQNSISLND